MFNPQRCWASGRPLAVNAKRSIASPSSLVHPFKDAGDISSVFPSLKPGTVSPPLPKRFAELKGRLIEGHEDRLRDSWYRLLADLRDENAVIKVLGSAVIPELNFWDMHDIEKRTRFRDQLRKRGVAVIRGVVTEQEALGWKKLIQKYIQTNASTKGRKQALSLVTGADLRLLLILILERGKLRHGAKSSDVSTIPQMY